MATAEQIRAILSGSKAVSTATKASTAAKSSKSSKTTTDPYKLARIAEKNARKEYENIVSGKTVDNTYGALADQYATGARALLDNQIGQLQSQLATSKAGAASNYNSAAAQNYINYMRQRNALPEQLAAQGINGGASESAMVRMLNNYALNSGNTAASRAAAMAELQNSFDTNSANLRNQAEQNILSNQQDMSARQIEYNYQLKQDAYNRWQSAIQQRDAARTQALNDYAATISRLNSGASIKKALNNLNKNDPLYAEKRRLILQQKATVQEKKLEQYSATIDRVTSVDRCKRMIDALKKTDPYYEQKKWILEQRMAQLGESGGGGGGGGGGGRRGYGGRGYGSGSGSGSGGSEVSSAAAKSAAKGITNKVTKGVTKNVNKMIKTMQNNKKREEQIRKTGKATNYGKKKKTYGKKTYKTGGLSQR